MQCNLMLHHKHVRILETRPRFRVIRHRARNFLRINAVPIKQTKKKAPSFARVKVKDGRLGPVTIRDFPTRQSLSSPVLSFDAL